MLANPQARTGSSWPTFYQSSFPRRLEGKDHRHRNTSVHKHRYTASHEGWPSCTPASTQGQVYARAHGDAGVQMHTQDTHMCTRTCTFRAHLYAHMYAHVCTQNKHIQDRHLCVCTRSRSRGCGCGTLLDSSRPSGT